MVLSYVKMEDDDDLEALRLAALQTIRPRKVQPRNNRPTVSITVAPLRQDSSCPTIYRPTTTNPNLIEIVTIDSRIDVISSNDSSKPVANKTDSAEPALENKKKIELPNGTTDCVKPLQQQQPQKKQEQHAKRVRSKFRRDSENSEGDLGKLDEDQLDFECEDLLEIDDEDSLEKLMDVMEQEFNEETPTAKSKAVDPVEKEGSKEKSDNKTRVLSESPMRPRQVQTPPRSRRSSPSPIRIRKSVSPIRTRRPSPSPIRFVRRSPSNSSKRRSPLNDRKRISPFNDRKRISPLNDRKRISPLNDRKRISPLNDRKRISPPNDRKRMSPLNDRKRMSPSHDRKRMSPLNDRKRMSPLNDRKRISPLNDRKRISPFNDRKRISPFSDRKRISPFNDRKRISPVGSKRRSPTPVRNRRSPGFTNKIKRSQSPIRTRRSLSPVRRRSLSPDRNYKSSPSYSTVSKSSNPLNRKARSPLRNFHRTPSMSPPLKRKYRASPVRHTPRSRSPLMRPARRSISPRRRPPSKRSPILRRNSVSPKRKSPNRRRPLRSESTNTKPSKTKTPPRTSSPNNEENKKSDSAKDDSQQVKVNLDPKLEARRRKFESKQMIAPLKKKICLRTSTDVKPNKEPEGYEVKESLPIRLKKKRRVPLEEDILDFDEELPSLDIEESEGEAEEIEILQKNQEKLSNFSPRRKVTSVPIIDKRIKKEVLSTEIKNNKFVDEIDTKAKVKPPIIRFTTGLQEPPKKRLMKKKKSEKKKQEAPTDEIEDFEFARDVIMPVKKRDVFVSTKTAEEEGEDTDLRAELSRRRAERLKGSAGSNMAPIARILQNAFGGALESAKPNKLKRITTQDQAPSKPTKLSSLRSKGRRVHVVRSEKKLPKRSDSASSEEEDYVDEDSNRISSRSLQTAVTRTSILRRKKVKQILKPSMGPQLAEFLLLLLFFLFEDSYVTLYSAIDNRLTNFYFYNFKVSFGIFNYFHFNTVAISL